MTDPRRDRVSNQKGYDLPLGFLAAAAVHVLLFLGLTMVFQWRTEPESFYAELWSPEDASGENVDGTASELPQEEQQQAPEPPQEEAPEPDPGPTPKELAKQAEEVIAAYQAIDPAVKLSVWRQEEDWVCIAGRRA